MAEELTTLLADWRAGDPAAGQAALAQIYAELRRLASVYLRDGHSLLQPTALVNEALLKLIGADPAFNDRGHFFATAARAMRQVLVDAARARATDKRGGGAVHLTLGAAASQPGGGDTIELLALDEALNQLERRDPTQARIVELRYFVGLSIDDTAAALALHPSAVNREWAMARAFLMRALGG